MGTFVVSVGGGHSRNDQFMETVTPIVMQRFTSGQLKLGPHTVENCSSCAIQPIVKIPCSILPLML